MNHLQKKCISGLNNLQRHICLHSTFWLKKKAKKTHHCLMYSESTVHQNICETSSCTAWPIHYNKSALTAAYWFPIHGQLLPMTRSANFQSHIHCVCNTLKHWLVCVAFSCQYHNLVKRLMDSKTLKSHYSNPSSSIDLSVYASANSVCSCVHL